MQAQLELLCLCSPNVTTEQFLKMLVKRAVPVLGEDVEELDARHRYTIQESIVFDGTASNQIKLQFIAMAKRQGNMV
jgi:hypothetical protein